MGRDARAALETVSTRLKGGDRLAPVTVVPPNTLAGLRLRRSFGMRSGGVVNLRVLVLPRLIEFIGAPVLAAEGRRPLSDAFRIESIRAVVSDTREQLLGDVPLEGAALRSLDAAFADFDACDEDALAQISANSARQRYLVGRYHAFRDRVRNFYDGRELALAAASAIDDGSASLRDIGGVALYLPGDLTPQQWRFLNALSRRVPVETVIGLSGDADVDQHALKQWPEPQARAAVNALPTAQHVLQAPDAEEETRAAIRALSERLANGQPLHRAAILYAQRDPYQRIAAEQLDAAGIPWNGRLPITYGQTIVGRTLLSLLQIAERATRQPLRVSWGDIVAPWLSGAPILDANRRLAPAARWNQIARKANLLSDPSLWLERLAQYRAKLSDERERLLQDADDEKPWRVRGIERDLDELHGFKAFLREVVAEIERTPFMASWSDYADHAQALLERYLAGRNALAARLGESLLAEVDRELEAWDTTQALLESLAQLDELGETDPARFLAAVERGLDRPAGRVGRFGHGVLVGALPEAAGADWDVVFILGATERSLPAAQREDPLLPQTLRSQVGLNGAADLSRRRRSEYLAALWSADERQLSYPRADVRGQRARLPSRWLLESASALQGQRVYGSKIDTLAAGDWFRATPSFEWAIQNTPLPGAIQEYDLRSLRRANDPQHHYLAASEPPLRRGFVLQDARHRDSFGEWDGHIAGGAARYTERSHSPTALQDWAVCPYRYFLGRVLRVAERDEAEEERTISPLERGALIHDILDTFFCAVGALNNPHEKWSEKHCRRLEEIADTKMDAAELRGVTGRDLLWTRERRLIHDDLQKFLTRDNERRGEREVVQIESEFAFGLEHRPAVPLVLPDGRTVELRGKIDRIDQSLDGSRLDVIDYKTGRATPSQGALDEDAVIRGQHLQLPVYAVVARAYYAKPSLTKVSTGYWFITERGNFGNPEVLWDDQATERFHDVLGRIVDGIGQGVFPAHPGGDGRKGPENCDHCAYDAVCSRDRQYAWDATSRDPRLADYVDLAEGEPS